MPPRINNDNDDGKNADKKYEVEATEKAQGDWCNLKFSDRRKSDRAETYDMCYDVRTKY